MASGAVNTLDARLRRRRRLVTVLTRWISVALGAVTLMLASERPQTRLAPGLAMVALYAVFNLLSESRLRRDARNRLLKIVHDVVDALALGGVAAFSGGSHSPVALILYPHVVALAVRGGFGYALAMGVLDGGVMLALAWATPGDALGGIHALALLACAVMGGTASAHLHRVRALLSEANREQVITNERLVASLAVADVARAEQDRVLERLRVSEERYRRLLEGIQDGVLILSDGRVAYCNEVFAKLVGEPSAALVGRELADLAPPEDRADVLERYSRWVSAGAVPGLLEARLSTRHGEARLVSLRVGTAEYAGQPAVITTVRDITRERQMELDVKAHAERLAAINEIANAVNSNLTIADILTVARDEARRLVPFDALSLALLSDDHPEIEIVAVDRGAGTRCLPFTRRDLGWAFKRPVAWCSAGRLGAPAHFEALFEEQGLQALASLPLFSNDRAVGALSLGRRAAQAFSAWDLAVLEPVARHIAIALDNARLLEAVRRRSRELESLLEISRGILERLDLAELLPLVTRSVNRVMGTCDCLLLLRAGSELRLAAHEGLAPELAAGIGALRVGQGLPGWVAEHATPLALDELHDDPRAAVSHLAERSGYRSYLCVPLVHDGGVLGTLEVLTRAPRRFTAEDQVLMSAFADQAAVAIANARLYHEAREHVAQLTRVNARLEELDRQRREYLRNVSHEFRTPLTVIKGYAEYMRDADPATLDVPGAMRVVLESCERVIDMVDTLIDLNRVEQGRARETLQIQALDLRELTETAVEPLRAAAERKRLELELRLPNEPLWLHGDAGLMCQVVRKLVDNAVKYSSADGHVLVSARDADGELVVEVADHGIGIPADHLPRIFDKFYMVDGGLTRRVGGSGVGLYLVREIVRLHDGRVEVESTPGQGSVFRVLVPRAAPDARPAPVGA